MNTSLVSVMNGQSITMSSREIAELSAKEHKNVLRDIDNLTESLGSELSQGYKSSTYIDINGVERRQYIMDKDAAICLVSGYDPVARMKIIKRWQELESQQPKLPSTYLEALQALVQAETVKAALEQENKILEAKIEEDAPAVEFHSEVVADEHSTFLIRQAAKIFTMKEKELRTLLESWSWIFRNTRGQWECYASSADRGWMAQKIERINDRLISFPAITGKGMDIIRNRHAVGDMLKHSARRVMVRRAPSH